MSIQKMLLVAAVFTSISSAVRAETPPAVEAKLVVKGLFHPLGINTDGTARLYITEQDGLIKILENGVVAKEPFLDLKKSVTAGGECGLLGLAFHPKFKINGLIYVNYTTGKRGFMDKNPGDLRTVVSELKVLPGGNKVDPKSERILLTVPQPYSNHNGGQLQFGPVDGYLYLGFGDGGNAGDPQNHPQNPSDPLGKFLRIDVDHRDADKPYAVPKDNPFVNVKGTLPEIWASGFRNPWRFSFDPETKELYAADVGEVSWEEVDVVVKGGNYGWSMIEGTHDHRRSKSDPKDLIPPIKEYPHTGSKDLAKYNLAGNCITGGFVYRGKQIPALQGWYVYGDFQACWFAAIKLERGRVVGDAKIMESNYPLSTFGVDAEGELYFCDYDRGAIYQIVSADKSAKSN